MKLLLCLLCVTLAYATNIRQYRQSTDSLYDQTEQHPVQLSDTRIHWRGHQWQLVDYESSDDLILSTEHPSLFSDEDDTSITFVNPLDSKHALKREKKSSKHAAKIEKKHEPEAVLWSPKWWLMSMGAFFCVVFAAVASGLTMGVVSIDPFDLQVILSTDEQDCESDEELEELRLNKGYAASLLPIVQRHHFVLVTLLVLNSLSNECMPLFLDRLMPAWLALLMSVTLVLIVGEIFPAAIFTGSSQLRLANSLTPIVWFFMGLFSPIAWPISKFLDWLLGADDEGIEYFKRGELKALIKLQGHQAPAHLLGPATSVSDVAAQLQHAGLSTDEINMIHGTLEFKSRTVGEVCLPFDKVFMLEIDDRLDADCLASILARGYSRVPVYEGKRSNIKGILLIKRLIVIAPEHRRVIRSLVLRRAMFVSKDMSLFDCLNEFQSGISHLAIVCSDPVAAQAASQSGADMPDSVQMLGILTLEDLIERLIKEPISDESDSAPHTVRALLEESRLQKARMSLVKSINKKLRPSALKKIHPSISPHHPHNWSSRRMTVPDDEKSLLTRRFSDGGAQNQINNYGTMSSIVIDTTSNEHEPLIQVQRNETKRPSARWSSVAQRMGLSSKLV